MTYDKERILQYWNRDDIESMYDKHLLDAEIALIKKYIPSHVKILDVGCGEGEGIASYATIPGVKIIGIDFSETRLKKAAERLASYENVILKQVDFLEEYSLDNDYDIVISQRFLINLTRWNLQKKALLNLMNLLKSGGRLLMWEGSQQGANLLNKFRAIWGLNPIPVKWHNLFFDDQVLYEFMQQHGYRLVKHEGLGVYFLLTRGVRPNFDSTLNWDCEFNRLAATQAMEDIIGFGPKFSRLKLWVFQK